MAGPADYLPFCSEESINELFIYLQLPRPKATKELKSAGAFHKIYVVTVFTELLAYTFPSNAVPTWLPNTKECELILRVSGRHIPTIKSDNEVAILQWLQSETNIPVPDVIAHDVTFNNPLGQEFMLMPRLSGIPGSEDYDDMTNNQLEGILDQLVDYHISLYSKPFQHIGGLRLAESGAIVPGPVLDETLWLVPDIEMYWPKSETYESLNPDSRDGYPSFVAWVTGYMQKYIHALSVHPSLSWLGKEEIKMLEEYLKIISTPAMAEKLNSGLKYVMAHRDLHFGNMLILPETRKINAIIDWEFAQIVPLPLWRRSFLWNGQEDPSWRAERDRLFDLWVKKMKEHELGRQYIADMEWKCPEQEWTWIVCNHMRYINQACPRGQEGQPFRAWWDNIVAAMTKLGVDTRTQVSP